MEPPQRPTCNHRGRNFKLEFAAMRSRADTWSCHAPWPPPLHIACGGQIAGGQPERPTGGVQVCGRLKSVHPATAKPIQVKVAALIRSKAVELRPSFIVRGQVFLHAVPVEKPFATPAGKALANRPRRTTAGYPLRWPILRLTPRTLDLQRATPREQPELEIENAPLCADGRVGFVLLDGT